METKPESAHSVTGHHFVREPLMLYHEQKQLVGDYFLDRLRR